MLARASGSPISRLGAERLATTFAAVAHRVWPVPGARSGCTVVVQLVMRDLLTRPVTATEPEPRAVAESVCAGTHPGRPRLAAAAPRPAHPGRGLLRAPARARCCGASAAASPRRSAPTWCGCGASTSNAGSSWRWASRCSRPAPTRPTAALDVLRALMRVIDERGQVMAGTTRLHAPMVGDPLHVLVIDELAALTAYADLDVRREANRLLAEILTQGRALGVVVVACVQDPRKDVVAMRGLFTQTVALRLRSADETVMVLGEGMTHLAPAHRISPTHPGIGWVVDDAGAADRVRADFWPDELIRLLASRLASPVRVDLAREEPDETWTADIHQWIGRRPGLVAARSPRRARAPRAPRTATDRTVAPLVECCSASWWGTARRWRHEWPRQASQEARAGRRPAGVGRGGVAGRRRLCRRGLRGVVPGGPGTWSPRPR